MYEYSDQCLGELNGRLVDLDFFDRHDRPFRQQVTKQRNDLLEGFKPLVEQNYSADIQSEKYQRNENHPRESARGPDRRRKIRYSPDDESSPEASHNRCRKEFPDD